MTSTLATQLGYVMGLHSLMSMVGSVLAGPGIDRHGTRLILALSYGLSAFSFLLVWAQPGMLAVYASRIFVLFQQALLASRAHIAIATGSDTKLISYVSLFYGFGSVLGPAAASIIVERYSLAHTSLLAGCVNLLSAVLVLVYGLGDAPKFWVGTETTARRAIVEVPGSNHAALARQRRILHRRRASSVNEVFTRSGIQSIVRCWRTVPAVRFVFSLKLLIVFATAIFHSVLALTMAERFGLAPAENGWVFAYCGGIAVAAQLAYNLLNIRANAEQRALFILSTVMALAYAATSISSSMLMFCAALLPLMGAGTVLHSITTAMLTRDIEMHDNGTIIGMDMAVSSLQRIISPLIGTWIIGQSASYASIGWACASMVVGSLIVQARALQNVGGKQLPH